MYHNIMYPDLPIIPLNEKYNVPSFIHFPEIFTRIECNKIKAYAEDGLKPSLISGGVIDRGIRSSYNTWLPCNEDTRWVYDKLMEITNIANETYKFELTRFDELAQVTEYRKGGFYQWHKDVGDFAMSVRKLSIVINLSDPRAYEGCEFQIFASRHQKINNDIGSGIVFPSYEEHRVSTLKEGMRHSLVLWVSGPPYR